MIHALFEIDLAHGLLGSDESLMGAHPRIDQRQLDVVQGGGTRQQVERLEDETDFLVANARQFVVAHVADQVAVDEVLALGGGVQAADEVHQSGLTGAGRPHDGDILAAPDLHIHAGDRMDFLVAHDVGFPQVVGANYDAIPFELFAALDERLFRRRCHADFDLVSGYSGRYVFCSVTGDLLSTLTWVSLRMVRIT